MQVALLNGALQAGRQEGRRIVREEERWELTWTSVISGTIVQARLSTNGDEADKTAGERAAD